MSDLGEIARAAGRLGICVIPAASDGSKRPAIPWAKYQTERPDREMLSRWFEGPASYSGIGAVCGPVSGGLEMLEFEGRAVAEELLDEFDAVAEAAGLLELVKRISDGYTEHTPSGGIHLLYRCEEVTGNLKLARRPATAAELETRPDDPIKVLIETRGKGGFTIIAPSNGTTHPNGGAWEMSAGGLDTIVTITPDERAAFHTLARSFDRMPPAAHTGATPSRTSAPPDGDRPGDLFNRQTTWADILEPEGWQPVHQHGETLYWRRPGARTNGIDATTNALGTDRLKVFSTSTAFDPDTTYDRFGAHAQLHHNGDLKAAGKALHAQGYAAPRTQPAESEWRPTNNQPTDDAGQPTPPESTGHDIHADPDLSAWCAPVDWSTFWTTDTPEQDWLIEPLVPAGRQVAMFSKAKVGKSLIALDASAALATGRPVLGARPSHPADVVYIDLEMTDDDVRERLEDLGYGPDADLTRLHYYLLPSLPPLDSDLGGQVVEAIARKHNARLVVVDTMARAVTGDENAADTYRGFYMHTGKRLKAAKIALLRLDHGGKDPTAGQRGSSAKADDVDIVFQLTGDDTGFTLRRTHSRIPWVPAEVLLGRHNEPCLRHVLTTGLWPEGTKEVAGLLDQHQVPLDARTVDAMRTLTAGGVGKRRQVVIAALKWRRQ